MEYSCRAFVGWVWDIASLGNASIQWDPRAEVGVLATGEDFSGTLPGLPAAYALRGRAALLELNGTIAGLILDRRDGSVVLFNDRLGLARIYYHQTAESFYFSSEAKSLLAVLPQTRQVDERGLGEYFTVGCVLQNRSLFREINLLPPSSAWIFHSDGRNEKRRYFDPNALEDQAPLKPTAYTEALVETFRRILPRYIQPGDGSAMSLTGGLDSRMILAWAHPSPNTIPCYTFAGPYRECADVKIARRLAIASGQRHSTLQIENDFFAEFDSLFRKCLYISDGTMDASGAVEVYVNRKARRVSPIRLTGNYGSEILRRNIAFRPARNLMEYYTPEFQIATRAAVETYNSERNSNRLSFIAFKQVPWHHYSRRAIEQSQLLPRSPFLDNDLIALAYRVPHELSSSPAPLLELIKCGSPALAKVRTDRQLTFPNIPLLKRLIRNLAELSAKVEYAFDYGMPERLVKWDHRLSGIHLERLVLGRHKFYHYRTWYKSILNDAAATAVQSLPDGQCFKTGVPDEFCWQHRHGIRNHTLNIHKCLSLVGINNLIALRT